MYVVTYICLYVCVYDFSLCSENRKDRVSVGEDFDGDDGLEPALPGRYSYRRPNPVHPMPRFQLANSSQKVSLSIHTLHTYIYTYIYRYVHSSLSI